MTATQRPSPTGENGPVESLLAEYLDSLKRGEHPVLHVYMARLETPEQREEFMDLRRIALQVEGIEPGTMVGPYRIEGWIGAGGMGVVYRAIDTALEKPVAVKFLHPSGGEDEAARLRFEKEARLLGRMVHPNIVAVHAAGEFNGRRYLVMELVEGISLDELIDELDAKAPHASGADLLELVRQPLAAGREATLQPRECYWRSVARIARDIVRGVGAAHAQGILHRDLKPANVRITSGGRPVVLDFGIAATVQDADAPGARWFATPEYASPEQIEQGRSCGGRRSDIYQLGLILYELLTGRMAFDGKPQGDMFDAVRRGDFRRPRAVRAEVPRALEAICLRAMARDPGQRYQDAVAMERALDRFLGRRKVLLGVVVAVALVASWILALLAQGQELVETLQVLRTAANGEGGGEILPGDLVRVGDTLSLKVRLRRSAYCYAVSIAGGPRPEARYVMPLTYVESERRSWRKLDHGPSTFMVSWLEPARIPGSPQEWSEGVCVFFSASPCSWLDAWIKKLAEVKVDLGSPGVPLREALAYLDKIRGTTPESMPPGQYPKVKRFVEEWGKAAAPFRDPVPYMLVFPIDRK